MRTSGDIRLFKLGSEANEFCIVFTEDYKEHVRNFTADLSISKAVIGRYFCRLEVVPAFLIQSIVMMNIVIKMIY